MSFEDIQKVTGAEQDARTRKSEAQAEAKRLTAQAHRDGAAAVEKARAEAEAQTKALMAQAEERAAQRAEKAAADNEEACKAMKQRAASRLDKAADLIVRKVVEL